MTEEEEIIIKELKKEAEEIREDPPENPEWTADVMEIAARIIEERTMG